MAVSKPVDNKHELSANNFIIIAALVTLVAIVLSFVAGRALVSQIVLNDKVIKKKSVAADQLQKNLDNIPTLKANYSALGSNANLILNSLPDRPEYPSVVASVEAIAGLSSVKLKEVSPSATTAPASVPVADGQTAATAAITGPQTVSFDVAVEGTYDNILKFFANLELSSRVLKIQTLTQQGASNGQQMRASAVTYWQAPADLSLKMETVK